MSARAPIYLDHAATTPVAPEVIEAMRGVLADDWANASSYHAAGRRVRGLVEQARGQVAALLGAQPEEIVFTSGGTESDHLAIFGTLLADDPHLTSGRKLVCSAVEHPAVAAAMSRLADLGYEVVRLPVSRQGLVAPAAVAAALDERTALVSIMLANNETGTLQPVAEIAALTRAAGVPFHVDAVQAVGKIPVDVNDLGCDLLACSAHKLHGPKGVGALWVRPGSRLVAPQPGGQQEGGLRGGTLNSPGIVGFGRAAELAQARLAPDLEHVGRLRARLLDGCLGLPMTVLNGHPKATVPHIVNLCFLYADAVGLQANLSLQGIAASVGSACAAGSLAPSAVLKAMGLSDLAAAGSLRLSLGRTNTPDEIDRAVAVIGEAVEALRWVTAPEDIGVCDENCPCLWDLPTRG